VPQRPFILLVFGNGCLDIGLLPINDLRDGRFEITILVRDDEPVADREVGTDVPRAVTPAQGHHEPTSRVDHDPSGAPLTGAACQLRSAPAAGRDDRWRTAAGGRCRRPGSGTAALAHRRGGSRHLVQATYGSVNLALTTTIPGAGGMGLLHVHEVELTLLL
jgi:hypothetical protein